MEWFALHHALLSHLPVATGLLLPLPLLAAQRAGRGIRPWWTVSRFLGWAGLLGSLGALVSGLAAGRLLGHIPPHRLLPVMVSGTGPQAMLFRHALLGALSLLLGGVAVWAMNRSRKDYQSLGILALVLGLAWSAVLLVAGENGYHLAHHLQRPAPVRVAEPVIPALPKVDSDPEAKLPVRALDFASLEAIQPDPVKSLAHGGRWVRAYASPEAAAAYRSGQPLPQGALVVLNSTEDRWGRPGPDGGPLYALEMKATGPSLTFYWARIPLARRREFGGESRVYWRGMDTHLEACRACHAAGMADPARRSHWRARRITPSEGTATVPEASQTAVD